ncbi:MAG: DUF1049 domain-containing protein [Gemmatimonadetes bacterium]|nr:MAG: DUF1049 domain-containing protein [Gemmatimonadota bacterium]
MTRFLGPVGVLTVVALAVLFSVLNGGQRVTLDFGLFVLYRVPVTLVAVGGLFLGMVVMFLAGIHTDLKVRAILRRRLADESAEERARIDRMQRDLFQPERTPGDEGDG